MDLDLEKRVNFYFMAIWSGRVVELNLRNESSFTKLFFSLNRFSFSKPIWICSRIRFCETRWINEKIWFKIMTWPLNGGSSVNYDFNFGFVYTHTSIVWFQNIWNIAFNNSIVGFFVDIFNYFCAATLPIYFHYIENSVQNIKTKNQILSSMEEKQIKQFKMTFPLILSLFFRVN